MTLLNRRRRLIVAACITVLLPPFLYLLITPDWYFIQNGLDPFIYSGYIRNLKWVLGFVGDESYILTRWPAYLPSRALNKVFGDRESYFVLRWFIGSLIVGSIIVLGIGRWRAIESVAASVVLLLSPMTVRMVFTDYTDHVVIGLATLLIVVVCVWPTNLRVAAAAGLIVALLVTSNPVAASIVGITFITWLSITMPTRRRLEWLAVASTSALLVLVAAFLVFRWRYGVPNLYSPTVDFLREMNGYRDPLKSRHSDWMLYRIWIYLPAALLGLWYWLVRRRALKFDRTETKILTICAGQYVFQWWYQFSRDGSTLELPYYWSYMVPALSLGMVIIVVKLLRSCATHQIALGAGAVVAAAALLPTPAPSVFGNWIDAVVVLGAIVLVLALRPRIHEGVIAAATVLVFFAAQLGAPNDEPVFAGEFAVRSDFDQAYDASSSGVDTYEAAQWFSNELDGLGDDVVASMHFWFYSGEAYPLAAMYFAMDSDRWVNRGWGADTSLLLNPEWVDRVVAGEVAYLALLGLPGDVDAMLDQLDSLDAEYSVVFDRLAPPNRTTRAVVINCEEPASRSAATA